ncbi:PSMD8 ATPase, partial [Thinocorus orbignyianus]|nr:PSMD8 ATPase [Thinocorus orbignyianus]
PPHSQQYLMEGSYNKVFLAKGNIPAESYTFFIDILLDTIREGDPIKPQDTPKIPWFSLLLVVFPQRGWVLGPNSYYSFSSRQQKPEDATIPSTELAKQVIEYA